MATATKFEEARLFAPVVTQRLGAYDTDVFAVIQYCPENGVGGATAATIAFVQSGNMTFLVDGAAPTGVDAIGTAGVVDTTAAAYDTWGELSDYINGLGGGFRCILHGALRATTLATTLAKTAASCIGAKGLAFYNDTSASSTLTLTITGEHFISNGKAGHLKDWDDDCLNQFLSGYFKTATDSNAAGELRFYEGKQGSTETQILTTATADSTALSVNESYPSNVWIEAHPGYRLIAMLTIVDTAAAFEAMAVRGRTIVQNGTRRVTKSNYI